MRSADPRHELGRQGEKLAAKFLKTRGYKVLCRNFRAKGGGEVDLICRQGDTFVFVEVKTRRGVAFGRPYEAVNVAKQHLIAKGARAWMRRFKGANIYHRFDIVEVYAIPGETPRCEIVPNAF